MLKKFLLFFVLFANTNAIQLKNGTYLAKEKVDNVYHKLLALYNEQETNKAVLLVDLYKACKDYNRKLIRNNFFICTPNDFDKRFEHAVSLELCDKEGNINEQTSHIILSSITCTMKAARTGLTSLEVNSPVSLWHYWCFDFLDEDLD